MDKFEVNMIYAVTTGPNATVWAVSATSSLDSLHSLWSNYEFQH